MGSINLDFFCTHCNHELKITNKDIIPSRELGYMDDEFLIFEGRCPNCLHLSKVNDNLIPNEVKLELLDKYSGIIEESYRLWSLEAKKKDLEKEICKVEALLKRKNESERIKIKEKGYQKRLYPHWISNRELIDNSK